MESLRRDVELSLFFLLFWRHLGLSVFLFFTFLGLWTFYSKKCVQLRQCLNEWCREVSKNVYYSDVIISKTFFSKKWLMKIFFFHIWIIKLWSGKVKEYWGIVFKNLYFSDVTHPKTMIFLPKNVYRTDKKILFHGRITELYSDLLKSLRNLMMLSLTKKKTLQTSFLSKLWSFFLTMLTRLIKYFLFHV